MILTGPEIAQQTKSGTITIEPFDQTLLNPNSYNYRLGDLLKIPLNRVHGPTNVGQWRTIRLPKSGYLLLPNMVYLAHTHEQIGSNSFVPTLIGRSSLGRLGLFLQISADLGQIGLVHRWTLELMAIQPIRVYPQMTIGQVSFWKPHGEIKLYQGSYQGTDLPTASRPWLEETNNTLGSASTGRDIL